MSDEFSKLKVREWRVLIVDDEPSHLMLASENLLRHGAEVKTARNGIEGLEILHTYQANLILLDLEMSGMNGWDMFKAVKRGSRTSKIPIIALTAHVISGYEDQVLQVGFDGCIPKLLSLSNLVSQIQSILGNHINGGAM